MWPDARRGYGYDVPHLLGAMIAVEYLEGWRAVDFADAVLAGVCSGGRTVFGQRGRFVGE